MNYKQKQEQRVYVKSLFFNNYPEGCIKITKGESLLHSLVKSQVCYWLKENDYEFWCEPNIIGLNSRPDIVCLHKNSDCSYIIEILASESKKSINNKEVVYPLPIIKVNAKNFVYKDFKI